MEDGYVSALFDTYGANVSADFPGEGRRIFENICCVLLEHDCEVPSPLWIYNLHEKLSQSSYYLQEYIKTLYHPHEYRWSSVYGIRLRDDNDYLHDMYLDLIRHKNPCCAAAIAGCIAHGNKDLFRAWREVDRHNSYGNNTLFQMQRCGVSIPCTKCNEDVYTVDLVLNCKTFVCIQFYINNNV
jgi:hypothetical protein